jgi:hypothetical protein
MISDKDKANLAIQLHNAIFTNDSEAIVSILSTIAANNIHIDDLLYLGVSPLQRAAFLGKLDLVKLFVQAGSDLTYQKNEKTAYDYAMSNKFTVIADYLQKMQLTDSRTDSEEGDLQELLQELTEYIDNCQTKKFIDLITTSNYSRLLDLLSSDDKEIVEAVASTYDKVVELCNAGLLGFIPVLSRVPGDGNCMYASCLTAANSEETIESLRQQVSLIISTDIETYRTDLEAQILDIANSSNQLGLSFTFASAIETLRAQDDRLVYIRENHLVEQYVDQIQQDRFWGGEVELRVLSMILESRINIVRPGLVFSINNSGNTDAPLIELYHHNNEIGHYDRIIGYDPVIPVLQIENHIPFSGSFW